MSLQFHFVKNIKKSECFKKVKLVITDGGMFREPYYIPFTLKTVKLSTRRPPQFCAFLLVSAPEDRTKKLLSKKYISPIHTFLNIPALLL